MYYIGYILGIVLILWLIITLVKALSGKKDKGSDAGPSSADYPSAGGSAGSEGSGIRTAVPGKGSEGGSMPSGEMPSGPMPSAGPAGCRPKEDAWRETERLAERSETEPAGLSEEIYMKAPSDIDLPKTSIYEKERGASLERSSRVREESSGTHSSGKEKTSGPVVRAGRDEPDEDNEKKTVILYREDTGKYRKRCPFCNTYLTSGKTFCEVCGSKVSA